MTDYEFVTSDEYAKRQAGHSKKYSIFIGILDPEKSEIAKLLNLKVPGGYFAVKSR